MQQEFIQLEDQTGFRVIKLLVRPMMPRAYTFNWMSSSSRAVIDL